MIYPMLSPTGLAPCRETQLRLGVENVKFVRLDHELDLLAGLHLLVGRHERDDLVALRLTMEELLVTKVFDDVDLRRNAMGARVFVTVQLQVLGAETDQQVPAAVLGRGFGRVTRELERSAAELEDAVVCLGG